MEGRTSTSNEGSKNKNLDGYKKAKVKTVSNKEIEKLFDLNGFSALSVINSIAFDVKSNQRVSNSESNPVSSSSADVFSIDLEDILENGVEKSRPHIITGEIASKIKKRRDKAKKAREEEKEARETEEAMQAKKEKEMEDNEIK